MLTTSELLEIQDSLQSKNSIQLIPILESPKTSKLDGPGIEINPYFISENKESKKAKVSKGLCFKHPNNDSIWFKIRNATNISHLIKIFDNRTIWKQQCTFPCHTVAACYCKNVIVVSLIDNTLNFIDSYTGSPCLPSILLSGYTKYLQRVDEDKIALITNKNQLIIYEIDANTIPKCLLKVYFYGCLEDIRYVELTQELRTKQLSPIIQTETNRYRYSIARQCWTLPDYEYKLPFVKPEDNFESLDNVIKNFGYSLLTHNQFLMEKTYLTMLDETPYECTIRLIEYHNSGIKEISGILLSDVLEHAFNRIQTDFPDVVERVSESEQYKLYLSNIKRKEAMQQNINSNGSNMNINSIDTNANANPGMGNNTNISTTNNLNMNLDNMDTNIISTMSPSNTSTINTPNTDLNNSINVMPNNNLLNNARTNRNPIKQQTITRELPIVESEKVSNRNSFDSNIYSPIQDTHDFFYSFNSTYDNYIEQSQRKDPKIDKYIEAFSYSSNEQKEIAKKLKLKLPSSKKRSKSIENDTKNDDQNNQKKKKRRFIKPEIIQKRSSQQLRSPQQQPLLLTSSYYQHPNQPIQQIPQNRNTLNLQAQNSQQQIQIQQRQNNTNIMNWLANELKNPKQFDALNHAFTKPQWDQIIQYSHLNTKAQPKSPSHQQPQSQQIQQQQQQPKILQQSVPQQNMMQQKQIQQPSQIQQNKTQIKNLNPHQSLDTQILQQFVKEIQKMQNHKLQQQQQAQMQQQQQQLQQTQIRQQPQMQQQQPQQQTQIRQQPQAQQQLQQQPQMQQQPQQHNQIQQQLQQQQPQQHNQIQQQLQQQQTQQHNQIQQQLQQQQPQQQTQIRQQPQAQQQLQQQIQTQQQQAQIRQQPQVQQQPQQQMQMQQQIQQQNQIQQQLQQQQQNQIQHHQPQTQQLDAQQQARIRQQSLMQQQPQTQQIQLQQQLHQESQQQQLNQHQIQLLQQQNQIRQQQQNQHQVQIRQQQQEIQVQQPQQILQPNQPQLQPQPQTPPKIPHAMKQQSIEEATSAALKEEAEAVQSQKRKRRRNSSKSKDTQSESDSNKNNTSQQTIIDLLNLKSPLFTQSPISKEQQSPSIQQKELSDPVGNILEINLDLQSINSHSDQQQTQKQKKK